ncbi:MAG: hypothetical protein ACR2M7_03910 [Bdellovibrionales bacterium]
MRLLVGIVLFLSCFISHAHPGVYPSYPTPGAYPAPAPYPTPGAYPPYSNCGYHGSSVCSTYSGRSCQMFAAHYQPSWFSACVTAQPFFYSCLTLPSIFTGQVAFKQQCLPRGTACVCSYPGANNYTYYEAGFAY